MFGFWLPIGLLLASVGLVAMAIAKRHNCMTAETYRLTVVIWSIAVIVLSIGIGSSSYQMEQTLGRFESVKAKADVLEKHIEAAEAQQQLMHFADPLQEEDPVALQPYREALRKKTWLISGERDALTEELTSARFQFDEFNQTRIDRDFTLFICVLVLASVLTTALLYSDALRKTRCVWAAPQWRPRAHQRLPWHEENRA